MALFRYEATDSTGRVMRGAMDAATASEVRTRLEGKGYQGVSVLGDPAGATQSHGAAPAVSGLRPAARAHDLGLFFRQLGALSEAGFTPSVALGNLAPRTASAPLSAAAGRLAQATGGGSSLAGAMAREGGLFPAHVVGLIAAGEEGGFLTFAFEEAALWAEQDHALRQGMGWPKFLIWQSVWSVILLAPLFPSIDFERWQRSFVNYGRGLLIGSVLGGALHLLCWRLGVWWTTPGAARARDSLCLKIPVMARLARAQALASFTRVLRKLLSAGIAPPSAYRAAARAVPNGILREKLIESAGALSQGAGLDAAIGASGLMDHDPLQLLITGQQSGRWLEMLDQVTALYQEEAARATEAARSAQKRVAGIITILSIGYVTIELTRGLLSLGFKATENWSNE